MIFILGRLLSISLSSDNYLVPLSEELDHVKLYMKIMHFRYNCRINVHFELSQELMQERIVKLTLQPLIENAIQHGLIRKRGYGDIWIRGKQNNNRIEISVVDNGNGISDAKLEQLRLRMEQPIVTGTKHIGLRNVNQRLKLVFGEQYGLRIDRAEEGGMCITICIRILEKN